MRNNFFHKVSVILASLYRALRGSLLVPVYVRSVQAVLCEHLAGRDFKEDVYVVELCIKGAFLWENPNPDFLSKITRIMVHQRNRRIITQSVFVASFDTP